jgi:hypothetical protein
MQAPVNSTATEIGDSHVDHDRHADRHALWHPALLLFLSTVRQFYRIIFRHFRIRPGFRSRQPEWLSPVDQVAGDLQDLNSATERDFLNVGGKLTEVRSVTRQISSAVTALTELVSGGKGDHTFHALSRILEHSKQLDARAEADGRELATVRELASHIPLAFSELRGRVMLFRTLCTLTRIETSRLGNIGSDFEGLAEAVKPLSESIHLSGERILAESSQLDQSIQTVLRDSSDLQSRHLAELRMLISTVMDSLRSFAERRRQAHEASVRQTARNDAVCEAVDNLVESIQFHDITRQQIEHVIHSLREVRSQPPSPARAILNLQASQLTSAEVAFASSVQRMRVSLEDIVARVRDMVKAGGQLMGTDSHEENCFFVRMESHCTSILEAIATGHTHSSQILGIAGNLDQTIGRMKHSVAAIREIEIQIQRIALNASIRAAQIAGAGNALNTIAEAMRRLVLDSSGKTENAARALDTMSDAARRVLCNAPPTLDGPADTNEILDEMRSAIVDLHSSSERSFDQVKQIGVLGSDLESNIGSILEQFAAGDLFAEVVTRARAGLQRITAEIRTSDDSCDPSVPGLESLADRYTMQVERDVHNTMANGAAYSQPVLTGPYPPSVEDGLGDNVELF